jgi:hypothetical protein
MLAFPVRRDDRARLIAAFSSRKRILGLGELQEAKIWGFPPVHDWWMCAFHSGRRSTFEDQGEEIIGGRREPVPR